MKDSERKISNLRICSMNLFKANVITQEEHSKNMKYLEDNKYKLKYLETSD